MKTWKNTSRRHTSYPSRYIKVKNMHDVIEAVHVAENKNLKIRADGSGHSFSDVAVVPDKGILLDMSNIDGITNPVSYKSYSGIKLIQDDHFFNSVVVSLGTMGIIYSLVIEVEKMY